MTQYIAIDGMSGSGKTTLATKLAQELGVPVFHLDEYGNDYEPFIGLPGLAADLIKTDDLVVIYEGVGVFKDLLDHLNPFRIFVSIPEEVRLKRLTDRDTPNAKRTVSDWQNIFKIWEIAEAEYYAGLRIDNIDLIVDDSDDDIELSDIVTKINEYISS